MKKYYCILFFSLMVSFANISSAQYQVIATDSNTYSYGNYYLLNVVTKYPHPLYINNDLGIIPTDAFSNIINYSITDSLIITTKQTTNNRVERRPHRNHYELSERIYSRKYAVSVDTLDGVDENLKYFTNLSPSLLTDSAICVYLTLQNGPFREESAKYWTRFHDGLIKFEKDNNVHITGTYILTTGYEGEGYKYYTLTGLSPEQKIKFLFLAENGWLNKAESGANKIKAVPKLFMPHLVGTKYLRKID